MADPNPMLSYVTPERRRRMGNAMMAEQYAENPPQLPLGYDWNGAPLSPELLAFAAQRGQPGVIQKAVGLIPGFDQDGARGRQSWGNAMMSTAQFPIDAVAGMGQALTAPARAYRGEFDPLSEEGAGEALNVAGNAMMGGFAAPKPRNSVGSAGGSLIPDAAALDMSHAARMKRAADEHHPSTFYHGTVGDYPYFDLSKGGQVSGSRAGSQGVSVSPTPDVANVFAQIAADKSGGNASVMPLRARLGKVGTMTLDGSEKNLEVATTLRTYFDDGYDTVVLKNYTTPGGVGGNTILVVKDPAQLRSVNAASDPAKRDSADLLSANGGRPGAATGAALGGVDIQDPALAESLPEYGLDVPSRPASPRYRPGDA